MTEVLPRSWYRRDALDLAVALLGSLVTTSWPDGSVTARITEVEAYRGEQDPGSHAFRGRTARNATMFGDAGHLYVYRHMGLHSCMNVVGGEQGSASAVLLRAAEIVDGADVATERRLRRGVVRRPEQLASGPARLTVALGITHELDGVDVTDPAGAMTIRSGPPASATTVATGPRVGVAGPGGDGALYPWRFWIADDPTVSVYRPGVRRTRAPLPDVG